jgi:hypothetical protein
MAASDFVTVTLAGTTYQIPISGANPPWGVQLQDYLEALAAAFNTVVGPADISETSAPIANNQSSPANVTGLSFDPSVVRASFVDYSIYITTNTTTAKEAGTLTMLYDGTSPVNSKWSFTRESDNDSGVVFSMLDTGQLQYTSPNISGSGFSGVMTFRARAVLQ